MKMTEIICDLCLQEIPNEKIQSQYSYRLPADIEGISLGEGDSIAPSHDINLCEDCASKIRDLCKELYREKAE